METVYDKVLNAPRAIDVPERLSRKVFNLAVILFDFLSYNHNSSLAFKIIYLSQRVAPGDRVFVDVIGKYGGAFALKERETALNPGEPFVFGNAFDARADFFNIVVFNFEHRRKLAGGV